MEKPELDTTNISILFNNIFCVIHDMMNDSSSRQEGSYDLWLCQDLKTGWYHVRAEPFNVRPHQTHNPIKMIGGWSPNREDPGSLYINLLEKLKKMFDVENILPNNWNADTDPPPRPPGIA